MPLKSAFLLLAIKFIAMFALSDKSFSDMGKNNLRDTNFGNEKMDNFAECQSQGGYFRINMPLDWHKIDEGFGLYADEKRIYGANLSGPTSKDGIASLISAHYYAPGHVLHETMERFLNIHAQPVLGLNLDGKEYGPVRMEIVAGRPSKVFERKVYEYIPPRSFNPKKIPLYERFVVIPASKGFFVLHYSAPGDISDTSREVFEKVLSAFQPLIK